MAETTKGGFVELRQVRAPDHVRPGQTFQVEADVSNGAFVIDPFDPDKCVSSVSGQGGYKIVVVFDGPGQTEEVHDCLRSAAVSTGDETYSTTMTAPESGRAWVDVLVRLPGSGKETGSISVSPTVTEEPPKDAPGDTGGDGGDGDSGWTPPWADGDGDDGPFAQVDQAVSAIVLIALLFAIAKLLESGSDILGATE
jgi:hypothetical protein